MGKGMSYRPLSDMESNGVYFERELEEIPPLICEYSGLPSVESYMDEEEYVIGHS